MKLIAHRGNINGRLPDAENRLTYIQKALGLGYDVEVDVRSLNRKLYLGHDFPIDIIRSEFIIDNIDKLWIHCKNIDAVLYMERFSCANFFYHEKDAISMTSTGYLWTYSGQILTPKSICVLPENNNFQIGERVAGICSDYIGMFK